MQEQPTSVLGAQWWRLGGFLGVAFVISFIIGAIVLQGDSPDRDASVEEVRRYFTDDGQMYLIGDYLLAIAFVLFFLPFAVTVRWVIGSAEGWPPILSWLSVIGAVTFVVFGGTAGMFWGALALGLAENPEIDDGTIRTLMELDTYGFAIFGFPAALFLGSTSFVMFRTGVMWRWLGGLGLLAAVLILVGSAWPIDGDEEGALAILGFIGFPLMLLWILITSVGLIMRKEPPPMERVVAR